MKCHEVRRLFFLYRDSELDSRSLEDVNLHLESCPACRERWSLENEFEEAIERAAWKAGESADAEAAFDWAALEARVRAGPAVPDASSARTAAQWATGPAPGVPAGAPGSGPGGPAPAGARGRRRRLAVAALIAGGLLGALGGWFALRPEPPPRAAARSAARHHAKYLAGRSPLQVAGPDPATTRAFFAGELGFPVAVPGRLVLGPDGAAGEAVLAGARRCTFLGTPVAYVVYEIGETRRGGGGEDPAPAGAARAVTVILGPRDPPAELSEAITGARDGVARESAGAARVVFSLVHGVLFTACGEVDFATLEGLLERFRAGWPEAPPPGPRRAPPRAPPREAR